MFEYKITYIDEISETAEKDSGIVAATDYGAAAARLAKYYGEVIEMYLVETEDVYTKYDFKQFVKEN